jgi:hypothetical protein
VIIEGRYLHVSRTPQEWGVKDLWTGKWKVKDLLDPGSASEVANEANENFRRAAERRIATPPDEVELEVLLALRDRLLLEHNAWTWRFYERHGITEWRALPPAVRGLLWHWRQNEALALMDKFKFEGLKKPPIGYFRQLMLSPVSAGWLDAHYPFG